jgi:DNA-binding phage protein
MNDASALSSIPPDAAARFLRSVGDACLVLARAIDTYDPSASDDPPHQSLEALGLGHFQRAVTDVLATADESGMSPREITQALGRGDEPNIRTTLESLRKKGVAELLPVLRPQRWRLAEPYRGAT